MTIKELCDKYQHCTDCPLNTVCCINDMIYKLITANEEFNKDVTKAIIETAKILQEEKNND